MFWYHALVVQPPPTGERQPAVPRRVCDTMTTEQTGTERERERENSSCCWRLQTAEGIKHAVSSLRLLVLCEFIIRTLIGYSWSSGNYCSGPGGDRVSSVRPAPADPLWPTRSGRPAPADPLRPTRSGWPAPAEARVAGGEVQEEEVANDRLIYVQDVFHNIGQQNKYIYPHDYMDCWQSKAIYLSACQGRWLCISTTSSSSGSSSWSSWTYLRRAQPTHATDVQFFEWQRRLLTRTLNLMSAGKTASKLYQTSVVRPPLNHTLNQKHGKNGVSQTYRQTCGEPALGRSHLHCLAVRNTTNSSCFSGKWQPAVPLDLCQRLPCLCTHKHKLPSQLCLSLFKIHMDLHRISNRRKMIWHLSFIVVAADLCTRKLSRAANNNAIIGAIDIAVDKSLVTCVNVHLFGLKTR